MPTQTFSSPQTLPRRLASVLALLGLSWPAAHAAETTSVVTHITSFHTSGPDDTSEDGPPKGWPAVQYPKGVPLLVQGENGNYLYTPARRGYVLLARVATVPSQYQSVSMPQTVFDRYGGLAVSTFSGGNLVQRANGDLIGVLGPTDERARNPETGYQDFVRWDDAGSAVGAGALYRTDFDGENPSVIASTQGVLSHPTGELAVGPDGAIYGVDEGPDGHGRIFRFADDDAVSIVHVFPAGPDGMRSQPNGIHFGTDGMLYGVVAYDRGVPGFPGTRTDPATPTGIVYRLDPAQPGSFRVLYTLTLRHGEFSTQHPFSNARQVHSQMYAQSHVVAPGDGWLYGTTSIGNCTLATRAFLQSGYPAGGNNVRGYNTLCAYNAYSIDNTLYTYPAWYDVDFNKYGTIYRVRTDGSGETQILHRFSETDGATPRGPLAVGPDGAIYGTTFSGGRNRSYDDIAAASATDPSSGSTSSNHIVTDGVLWRIRPARIAVIDGAVTDAGFEVVHEFAKADTGKRPIGVATGADGRLYGATVAGGRPWISNRGVAYLYDNKGTIWSYGPQPAASATLTIAPAEIGVGGTAELTWTSDRARDCRATSSQRDWTGPQPTSGSITLSPQTAGIYNYSLACTDEESGQPVTSATVILRVDAPANVIDGTHHSHGNGGTNTPLVSIALLGLWLARRRPHASPVR